MNGNENVVPPVDTGRVRKLRPLNPDGSIGDYSQINLGAAPMQPPVDTGRPAAAASAAQTAPQATAAATSTGSSAAVKQRELPFWDAVKAAFSNYFTFNGRASRSEFWWFCLFVQGTALMFDLFSESYLEIKYGEMAEYYAEDINTFDTLGLLFSLATIVPFIAVLVRRLHDAGLTGKYAWYLLFPIVGWGVLIRECCKPSQPSLNEYGAIPNEITN